MLPLVVAKRVKKSRSFVVMVVLVVVVVVVILAAVVIVGGVLGVGEGLGQVSIDHVLSILNYILF